MISDDARLAAALPTIEYLIKNEAKVIIASHLGRPKGKPEEKWSLEPIATELCQRLNAEVLFSHEIHEDSLERMSKELKNGHVLVLENLRFHPGEESNDLQFCYLLQSFCDIFVNDAFGTCHRKHASTYGLAKLCEQRVAGLLLEKEIHSLSEIAYQPLRPMVGILGGAKVSDKVKTIESLMRQCSKLIIGGAMAYTFLKSKGFKMGRSLVEESQLKLAEKLLSQARENKCEIILPVDHMVSDNFDNITNPRSTSGRDIEEDDIAMDIGPETREKFRLALQGARSIFWNGPMGVFEKAPFHEGTYALAKAVAESSAIHKVCGGGDSVSAVRKSGYEDKFSHISTGGGASLKFLEGSLAGIEVLKKS